MLKDIVVGMWPMLLIFVVIIVSVRIAYLLGNREKIVLYKELIMLVFAIYVLILFNIVTSQESSYGVANLMPFKEIFRYHIGSPLFIKNVIGNILLFVPFGLFVAYYMKNHRFFPVFILSLISSLSIEVIQGQIHRVFDIDDIMLNVIGGILGYFLYTILYSFGNRVPRLFKSDFIKSIIVVIIITFGILYFMNFDTATFIKSLT